MISLSKEVNKNYIVLLFLLIIPSSYALSLEEVSIQNIIREDLSIQEIVTLNIIENEEPSILLSLPPNSYNAKVNDIPTKINQNTLNVPLNCKKCNLTISYTFNNAIKEEKSETLMFSRTIDFPSIPKQMDYVVSIPPAHIIDSIKGKSEPPIVPPASGIETDGKSIIITWSKENPSLPQRYFIKYQSHEGFRESLLGVKEELQEGAVQLLILTSLILGLFIGIVIQSHYSKKYKKRDVSFVPSTLLSPDERIALKLLGKNKNKMNQKEIGKQLNWSKSKVSAIMSNLQYKEIIKKEKFGRNYKVKVIKKIGEN